MHRDFDRGSVTAVSGFDISQSWQQLEKPEIASELGTLPYEYLLGLFAFPEVKHEAKTTSTPSVQNEERAYQRFNNGGESGSITLNIALLDVNLQSMFNWRLK